MAEIAGQATVTLEDFLRVQRLILRPRPLLVALGALVLLAWLVGISFGLMSALETGKGFLLPLLLLACAAWIAVTFLVYIPWRWRRVYQQMKSLHVPFNFSVSDSGVSSSNEFGAVELPWSLFRKWRSNEHLFLLFQSDVTVNILPKRFLSAEQAKHLETLLKERLGHAA